jgi:hypothetical protein
VTRLRPPSLSQASHCLYTHIVMNVMLLQDSPYPAMMYQYGESRLQFRFQGRIRMAVTRPRQKKTTENGPQTADIPIPNLSGLSEDYTLLPSCLPTGCLLPNDLMLAVTLLLQKKRQKFTHTATPAHFVLRTYFGTTVTITLLYLVNGGVPLSVTFKMK